MPFDFRRFDIYRKVPKDLTQPTYTGAIISVCCCLFILFLFLSELTGFITTEVVNELYVDDPDKDSGGKIDVSLNISLPNLHCDLVGLDIQDEMGRHEVGHIDNSMKIPLNSGAGCRFEGQFSINKVPGNFHVSTHSASAQPQNPDMTHVIHKLSFGDTLQVQNVHGAFNALGGADRLTSNPLASHDYILKIVPTVYEDKSGKQRYSYQYTVANKILIFILALLLGSKYGQFPGSQGVRRLQPHGPHHPCHLVPLRPQPHHGQVHRETAAPVQVHHHDLCHHRRDLHGSWHSGLVYLHSLGGLEEDPAGQDALTTCPPGRRGPRATASPAPAPRLLPPSVWPRIWLHPKVGVGGGSRWLMVLQLPLFPVLNVR
ncbi:endoplasmic reticulum-Golgi intermediate compartment protein 1 isoform X1 [Myotis myotis]|uniref:endoplasmic reticulum-Golgi intermediate compartment protein 1 isoform X1 n=2 Tax=Myotis myotis TaxID=51298 RepID=UPI00174B517C|nr:endoplasmic reticulum-Golgi intermediate compartment protein 1 isoform X1 [Myotis myotis]